MQNPFSPTSAVKNKVTVIRNRPKSLTNLKHSNADVTAIIRRNREILSGVVLGEGERNPKYVFTYASKTLYPNRVVFRVAKSFLRRRNERVNALSLFCRKTSGVYGVRFPIGRLVK